MPDGICLGVPRVAKVVGIDGSLRDTSSYGGRSSIILDPTNQPLRIDAQWCGEGYPRRPQPAAGRRRATFKPRAPSGRTSAASGCGRTGITRLLQLRRDTAARCALREKREMRSLRLGRNGILPGQYYDAETGLNCNYYREYDPSTGRYVESDPIGLDGGSWSTYTYASANPVGISHPSGLGPTGPTAPSPASPGFWWPGPLDQSWSQAPWAREVYNFARHRCCYIKGSSQQLRVTTNRVSRAPPPAACSSDSHTAANRGDSSAQITSPALAEHPAPTGHRSLPSSETPASAHSTRTCRQTSQQLGDPLCVRVRRNSQFHLVREPDLNRARSRLADALIKRASMHRACGNLHHHSVAGLAT